MGRSPGKWIKTMLFGKKTTGSNSTKGRNALKAGNGKGYTPAKGPTTSTEISPVISEPVLVSTYNNGFNQESQKGDSSSSGADVSVISCTSPGAMNQAGLTGLNEGEKFREEQAAIKAQAVFRGFLARRAFRALKGIIRLQALVRGHLVRRQAVATLRSILGIIKLQALARKRLDSRKNKPYSNAFVCKLLHSSAVVMPLKIQYDQEEPNSVTNWMNRWTISQFWKPIKKSLDTNIHPKKGSYAVETESGRSKRNVHRNTRKVADHPQSELEKVKCNLRKVTSSFAEANRTVMVIQPDTREQSVVDDIALIPDPIPDDMIDNPPADSNPLPSVVDKEENKQTCDEPKISGKRRASFSAKSENAVMLPSYMQATESAKAKLRGLGSPMGGSDSAETNGVTRRHSLPSSHSPRPQRMLQASGKGGIRSDRSLLSSRDANEKLVQVEWRR